MTLQDDKVRVKAEEHDAPLSTYSDEPEFSWQASSDDPLKRLKHMALREDALETGLKGIASVTKLIKEWTRDSKDAPESIKLLQDIPTKAGKSTATSGFWLSRVCTCTKPSNHV